ncbi:MAG TPA: hypothetical protein VJP80_08390 [Candidatus Saccharimonadales bacterium]|nr:hypothetical protein [Candidatus Saccharimonadales bacterium]
MKQAVKIVLTSLVALILLLITTQPTKLPSALLILPFVLMFFVLTGAIGLLLSWRSTRLTAKKYKLGALGASLPVLLLVLQSIGQLTLRDVLIIIALFALAYFYVARMAAPAR